MRANRTLRSLAAVALLAAPPALARSPEPAPTVPLLIGAGEAEAVIRLGRPDIARREAGGAVWTYRRPGCALFLYLRQEGSELRVTGAAAGPRRRGQPAPDTDACLAAVAAAKL